MDKAELDDFIIKKMQKARIVGLQAGLISGGRLVWEGSFGLKNIQTGEKVNDSTLFMIASCSKPVTALAIMKLYEKGLLDPDDDINLYLPYTIRNPHFPEEKITFRMLLTHISSLRDDFDVLNSNYTLRKGGDSPIELELYVKDYSLPEGRYYNPEID